MPQHIYRYLGNTGVFISKLCLGTMNFGYRTPEADAIEMMHAALDKGINFIDTANFYGQPMNDGRGQGITEEIVGKALAGRRDRVILATKVYMPTRTYPEDPNAAGLSRRHIIMEVENSLRRLNTDWIDLYQLHRFHPQVPIDETLRALDDLVRSGKVRYIGTSKFDGWRLVESLWQSERLNLHRFVSEQPRYSLIDRSIEREVVPVAQKYNISLLPYSPLGGGLLTGRYKQGETAAAESRVHDDAWGEWAQSFIKDNLYEIVDTLKQIAAEKDASPAQIALAWVMQQPAVSSVIIGPRTMHHLEDNLGALEIELSPEEVEALNAVSQTA